jgi:hypothetical protein
MIHRPVIRYRTDERSARFHLNWYLWDVPMLKATFSLLDVIGRVLRAGLAAEKGDFPERWVESAFKRSSPHVNERERAERKARRDGKSDSGLPPPIG